PTIGLDVVVKHSIRELILRMNRELGTTVFLTSHDTGDVEHVCRRAIIIDQGKIVLDEAVKKLKYNYLNQKLITVRFEQPQPSFAVPEGITMLKAGSNAARLSVDTRVRSVDEVMRWLTDRGGVADLTVENPPLEETIAAIFKRREAVCREKLP
ncbi:MAG TPA: ABC transporter, partial [Firmicutes bacterium]|nr:ABC transporter [Bacillota bacterium]